MSATFQKQGLGIPGLTLLSIFLALIAFGGFLAFSFFLNPGTISVVVARKDIAPGTILTRDLVGFDDQKINSRTAAILVTENELDQFVGGVVVSQIYAYQPVAKAMIAVRGNPASSSRLSLALSDTSLVAMTIPVTKETSPPKIVRGDCVNLNFGVGSASFLAGSLSSAPTPFPFVPAGNVFATAVLTRAASTPTATSEPRLTLPIAKTIVQDSSVLSVVFDETPNPAYTGPGSTEPALIQGGMIALVVTVPKEAQEMVHFGIVNGSIRIALLSATQSCSDKSSRRATLGMTWDDFIAVMQLDRAKVLATQFPNPALIPGANIEGPGAAAIKATQDFLKEGTQQSQTSAIPTSAGTPTPAVSGTPAPSLTPTATRRP